MNRIGLLEVIESVKANLFSTIKNMTVESDDFCCAKHFVMFNASIRDEEYCLKIVLTDTKESIRDTVRYTEQLGNNPFSPAQIYAQELMLHPVERASFPIDVILIRKGRKPSVEELRRHFPELTETILAGDYLIHHFSLQDCEMIDNKLCVSLINKATITGKSRVGEEKAEAFKNYLLYLNLVLHDQQGNAQDPGGFDVSNCGLFEAANFQQFLRKEFGKIAEEWFTGFDPERISALLGKIVSSNISPEHLPDRTKTNYLDKTRYKIFDFKRENLIPILDLQTNRFGYTDYDYNPAIDFVYEAVGPFEEGVAVVKHNGKYGAIDAGGKTMIPFHYEELIWDVTYNLFIAVQNHLYGLIDRNGKIIAPLKYEWIGSFVCSLAPFQDAQTHKMGFIDTEGNEAIEAVYEEVTGFESGFAKVRFGNQWRTIDVEGEIM